MDKKISFLWAFGAGALFLVLSLVMLLFGFGNLNSQAPIVDYVIVFLTGTLIGVALVYFLRRSEQPSVFKATLIAFAISVPFALFGITFGGMVGGIGIFFLGVSPAIFITAVGYFIGRAFVKK